MTHVRVLALALEEPRRSQVVNYAGRAARAGIPTVLVTVEPFRVRASEVLRPVALLRREQRRPVSAVLLSRPVRLLRKGMRRDEAWSRRTARATYDGLRPFFWWRALRRERLDLASFTHVVITGRGCWPIAWHVARANPAVVVDSALDVDGLAAQVTSAAASS
jgi:hypothetical protein